MRLKLIHILVLTGLIACSCQPKEKITGRVDIDPKAKMANQLTMAVLWYQSSAEMQLSYLQAYHYAKMLLDNKLAAHKGDKKPAVVLDIDETVLDNSPYEGMLIKTGSTYTSATWDEWVEKAQAAILPGALEFLNYAMEQGVEVFYISNRSYETLQPTLENLNTLALPNVDSAHVLLKKEISDKTPRRNHVRNEHDILLLVGDNLADFSELYADRNEQLGKDLVNRNLDELLDNFVMLPNPMYGEWEKAIYKNDYSIGDSVMLEMREEAIKVY